MVRHKLSDPIVVTLLQRIATGELRSGEHLPAEGALSVQLGVGRSVMREALRDLAAKGFVELRQGAATVVAQRSRWQTLDPIYLRATGSADLSAHALEALRLIKPRLAALAATRATFDDLDQLRKVAEEDLPIAFDDALAAAAHNEVLAAMLGAVRTLAGDVGMSTDRAARQRIIDAIDARDPEAASAAARLDL